jgi:lipopolysaccharide export system protein LptA
VIRRHGVPLRSVALLAALLPARLAAQQAAPTGRCTLQFAAEHPLNSFKLPSGQYNIFTGGHVVARCPAQGLVLRSDSLESYGDEGRIVFIGHADYSEPRLKLTAENLTYFQRDERVLATQNVNATLPTGSTLRGPQVEFLRAVPRVRSQQYATATGRPTVSLVERDPQGRAQPPVQVTGENIYLQGDSIVSAVGNVVVVRPELTATGDSLFANSGSGLLRIMRNPRITGTKGRPFTLEGQTIDLLSRRRKLERVLAKREAVANSEDLNLRSDTIDLRVTDDLLQRAVAWGEGRARATSLSQSMLADSIDVMMPAQRIRELHAVRNATAEGAPDTTKFRTTEKDRLTGDTIVALFDSVPAKDTARKPRIRELIAIGSKASPASSLQHLPPRDTSLCRPDIVYVRGRLITVDFDTAKVSRVTVADEDKSGGLYLEAKPDSASRCHQSPVTAAAGAPGAATGTATGAARPASASPSPSPTPAVPPAPTPAVPAPASSTTAPKRP